MMDGTDVDLKEIIRHMKSINVSEVLELSILDEQRTSAKALLGSWAFVRVSSIVDKVSQYERVSLYDTICSAALAGYDFSAVESIQDIADVCTRFFIASKFGL